MKKSKLMQPLIVLFVLFIFEGTASAQRVLSGKVMMQQPRRHYRGLTLLLREQPMVSQQTLRVCMR
jgi:hypothetical protein